MRFAETQTSIIKNGHSQIFTRFVRLHSIDAKTLKNQSIYKRNICLSHNGADLSINNERSLTKHRYKMDIQLHTKRDLHM